MSLIKNASFSILSTYHTVLSNHIVTLQNLDQSYKSGAREITTKKKKGLDLIDIMKTCLPITS